MKTVNVPGRLHSVAVGNVLTGANEIYDDRIRKNQAVINDEVKNNITNILNDITDLQEESGLVQQLADALREAGEADLAEVILQTAALNTRIEQVNRSVEALNNQLNGLSLVVVSEDEYQVLVDREETNEDTLYYVTENEEEV